MIVILSRTPEPHVVPPRCRSAGLVFVCALAGLGLSACKDALTDPMVGIVAEESAAALALGVSFADPRQLSGEDGGPGGEMSRALEEWGASWESPPAEGRAMRQASYAVLASGLAGTLGAEDLAWELRLLGEGVLRARSVATGTLPPSLMEGIGEAGTQHAAAVVALERGDAPAAIEHLLRGGDALREVGPEAVARALQQEVEATFGRISPDDSYPERDLERLRRLVSGGREAIEQGAWVLAIRRAYYARALLEGRGG